MTMRQSEHLWVPHPTAEGVELLHQVRGDETGGRLSLHWVRIAPGKELPLHAHGAQFELHEVLEGSGRAVAGSVEVEYEPGVLKVIPEGMVHRVEAGPAGLLLQATFAPSLC